MVEQHQRWLPEAVRATFEIYRQTGDRAWVAARGGSMRPLIPPGARLLVEFGTVPTGVGEVILFVQGERLVAHRVVAWRQDRPIAKGDAEAFCDALVDRGNILGVVRALRCSPNAPASSFGCAGRFARVIAHVSWWSSRGAAYARRAATILPDPLRRGALRALPLLARVAAQVFLAPINWVARLYAVTTRQ